jgi:hypothetical protein
MTAILFKAQHSAAAKAALGAALKLAQEARNAAKEAEAVAMAKQYHAAHLSSEILLFLCYEILRLCYV